MPRKKTAKKAVKKTAGAVELFSESIKTTFDLNIFVVPLMAIVFGIIAMIAIGIVSLPFIVIGAGFAAIGTIAPLIAVVVIGVFVLLVLFVVALSIINGFYYKSLGQYIKEKKVSIEENLRFAFGKWQTLVGVSLLEMLVSAIIMLLIIVPAMSFIIGTNILPVDIVTNALASNSTEVLINGLIPVFVVLGLAFSVMATIMLFVNPLVFLWFPTAVFGKKPALESVRKGYEAGKANYLRNFGALLLMGIVGGLVVMVQMVDPTAIIGIVLGIWIELASVVMIVKIYREGA